MNGSGGARRPKVLLLIKGLGLGGAERLLAQSIPHLDRESFEYEVCYLTPWKDDLRADFEQADIPVFCLDVQSEINPAAAFRLLALLRRRKVDLIHSHSPYPAVLARITAPLAGVRALVHTEHSLPRSRRMITEAANHLTRSLGDRTIAVSQEVARAIGGRHYPDVIHGGVDVDVVEEGLRSDVMATRSALGIPPEHLVVGNVSHLRPQKDLETFLSAAARILESRPKTTFVIIGREKEAGYLGHLRQLAGQLGIESRVVLTGFMPNPYPVLATFDVFMMTSRFEGFPIALVEAMVLRKPIVATAVGGVAEAVIDQETGLLVGAGDPAAIAKAVNHLLDDEAERSRMGAHGRRVVEERFSMASMVERIESTYREVLG